MITDGRGIRVITTEHLWDVQETQVRSTEAFMLQLAAAQELVVRHLQRLHNTNRVVLIRSVWLKRR